MTLAREVAWRVWKPYRSNRLLSAIRRGNVPVDFRDLPYYRPNLLQVNDSAKATILGIADMVSRGTFPFLGYAPADLGFPPSWDRDFVSGYAWERLPAAQVRPVVRHNGSDVKVPWELSRLQFLPVLVKAHLLSRDEAYRNAAKVLLTDWIENNPVGVGVNWTMAMESALRGMSLCFTLSLLQPLRPDEQDWGRAVTRSIWEHLLYTEASLEFSHIVRSNHYLANIVGLLCMTLFLEGPGISRRRDAYQSRVQDEIFRQVREDGGDYEASLGYHVLVQQMFTSAFLLLHAAGCTPRPDFTHRLRNMHGFLAAMADGKGCVPHVGDCDDGRTELWLDDLQQMLHTPLEQRNSLRIRSLLGFSNALFAISDKGVADDLPWYGLEIRPAAAHRPPSALFRASGMAVARREQTEIVFCALPDGIQGRGSHTHNDKLSIVARIGEHELFCDCGTCFYTRDVARRNAYRSTAKHNTVMIDAQEQNTINPDRRFAFSLGNEAVVTPIEVQESESETRLSASHFGYCRLGVEHNRNVCVSSQGFVVEDSLRGCSEHDFELHWYLPSLWRVTDVRGGTIIIDGPRRVRMAFAAMSPVAMDHGPADISRTYGGAVEKGTAIALRGRAVLPCQIITRVAWE